MSGTPHASRRRVAGIITGIVTSVVAAVAMVAPMASATGCAPVAYSGAGTSASPIQISSAGQLVSLSATPADWGKYFVQTVPLDLTGCTWTPIGNTTTPFTGSYSGSANTISNLSLSGSASPGLGLFGAVRGATLSGVSLHNVSITGSFSGNAFDADQGVGALVGIMHASRVEDVSVTGVSITSSGRNVGGVIGLVDHQDVFPGNVGITTSSVVGVTVSGQVTAPSWVGGVMGFVGVELSLSPITMTLSHLTAAVTVSAPSGGVAGGVIGDVFIDDSYGNGGSAVIELSYASASGNVSGRGSDFGGLVGRFIALAPGSTIVASSATGDVTVVNPSNEHKGAGGLVGTLFDAAVIRSGATGDVIGRGAVGGLVGFLGMSGPASVSASFATGDVSGATEVGGLIGEVDRFSSSFRLTDSYARGEVLATARGGGLVGYVGLPNSTVERSYATGRVTAGGGFLGALRTNGAATSVVGSFWDVETSATTSATGGSVQPASNATGHTTADMTSTAIYTAASWDITVFAVGATVTGGTVWGQCPGLYPFLMWQPDRPSVCPQPSPPNVGDVVLPPGVSELVTQPVQASTTTTQPPSTTTTVPVPSTVAPTEQAPSPVLIDGVSPELVAGEAVVLEDGRPVTVEMFVDNDTELVLRSQTFELRLAGDCSQSACTIDTTPQGREVLTLERDGLANVNGFGFLSGTPVHVWLFSEPRYLGQLMVRADGTFGGDMALGDIDPGLHTLQVNGTSFDGKARSANLGVIVNAGQVPAPGPGVLPSTGVTIMPIWLVALALLGTGLVATTRRRTSAH